MKLPYNFDLCHHLFVKLHWKYARAHFNGHRKRAKALLWMRNQFGAYPNSYYRASEEATVAKMIRCVNVFEAAARAAQIISNAFKTFGLSAQQLSDRLKEIMPHDERQTTKRK